MDRPLFLLFSLIFAVCPAALADADVRAAVSRECNAVRAGDSFDMSVCAPVKAGGRGTGVIWLMPADTGAGSSHRGFVAEGDTVVCLDYPARLSWVQEGDTLLTAATECRGVRVDYLLKPPVMRLPMAYGDSIASPTLGRGVYGKRLYIGRRGHAYTVADGTGMLTDGTDTLRHVLRLHSRHEYRQTMTPDTAAVSAWLSAGPDSDGPVFTEECYRWYGAGSRYPVMELVTETVTVGSDTVQSLRRTLLHLPALQRTDLGPDPANEALLALTEAEDAYRNGYDTDGNQDSAFPADVDAVLSPDGRTVTVTYSLSAQGDVRMGVFDAAGRSLATVTRISAAPGTHTEAVTLSTAAHGGNLLLSVFAGDSTRVFKVRTE